VVNQYQIDKAYFRKIKSGEDILLDNGQLIPNRELTLDPPRPWNYAYCSDTVYTPALVPSLKGIRVLYHEATFLETEAHLAGTTKHSTAKQAARIARDAGVEALILGHFSTRYKEISRFVDEAKPIFSDVLLADDGKQFEF